MKRITIGADHAGFALKEKLKDNLVRMGWSVRDVTPEFHEGDDYPAIGRAVARAVRGKRARGLLVCGSGEGVAIAANRVRGARAVVGHDANQVKKAREHNDMNILCLSGWNNTVPHSMRLIRAFLGTPASDAVRHRRRVRQLDA
jgi:ribose 5-phosphate isomerase B